MSVDATEAIEGEEGEIEVAEAPAGGVTVEELVAKRAQTRAELAGDLDSVLDIDTRRDDDEWEEKTKPKEAPSEYALDLDGWSIRRGAEVFADSELIQKNLGIADATKVTQQQVDDGRRLAADFYAAAFEADPKLAKNPKNARLSKYMQALLETPEFKALHNETMGDDCASEFAAASFAEKWVALVGTAEPANDFQSQMQAIAAAGGACDKAKEDVSDLRNGQAALGMGGSGGSHGNHGINLRPMFHRIRSSRVLRRIMDLAGKYRRFAQAKQRKKVLHGRDDMVGVVQDGEIARLLPNELAKLTDEDLELDTMRRIVERQAMCRDHRGVEAAAKGPIVVVVDESGSMSGEPIANAKAMALAMAWIAQHQNRYCALVGFSGGTDGTWCVLPPGKRDQDAMLDWLDHFFSGGTDMDVPLKELPEKWDALGCPKGKTDIIMITDAICRVPKEMEEQFLAFKKKEKVKLSTIIIGHHGGWHDEQGAGDIARVSDRVHCVAAISLDSEAVGEAFSV